MAEITIEIPDARLTEVIDAFVEVHPNPTNPLPGERTTWDGPQGLSDQEWMEYWLEQQLDQVVHTGRVIKDQQTRPALPKDDTLINRRRRAPGPTP